MILLALLVWATQSSGYALLPRQDNAIPIPPPTPQDVNDICSTCPEMRTLISILWSCFSTLILATWVSVHPNIPPPGATFFQISIIRFGTMMATILAPEVMFMYAYGQRIEARRVYLNPKFREQGMSSYLIDESLYMELKSKLTTAQVALGQEHTLSTC